MDINTGQIIESLKKQLENHKVDFDVSEVGEVIMVGDGVARVQGLENVLSSEMVELPNGVFGMAMNLEEENVGIAIPDISLSQICLSVSQYLAPPGSGKKQS